MSTSRKLITTVTRSVAFCRVRGGIGAIRRDQRGLALLEFAFTLPLVLAVGGWGIELSFMSLMQMRVSQYALNLADNASRVGVAANAGVTSLREADVNDVLHGARLDGAAIGLTTNGRITLSSLENTQQGNNGTYVQKLHWQRCIGLQRGASFDSHYGTVNGNASNGNAMPNGMGDADAKVNAPPDSGVMFVEINYRYAPLFGSMFLSPQTVHYTASYIVRDNRDFTQIYNPSSSPAPDAVPSTCDRYTA